jgi:glycosyltransferase involved in cell wall biosynthesis
LPKAERRGPNGTAGAARHFIVGYVAPREESLLPPTPSALWQALGEAGVSVRLRGASRQRQALGAIRGLEVRSRQRETLTSFLSGLDCLAYDVNQPEDEGWGIELFNAMAMGIPVLCSTKSCYAARIAHGSNGFVCGNEADFLHSVDELRKSTGLASRMGAAAREFAAAEFGIDALRCRYEFLAYG